MIAKIEITTDILFENCIADSQRALSSVITSGVAKISRIALSDRDSGWFKETLIGADAQVRSALGVSLTTYREDISSSLLRYNIECRDNSHAIVMAHLIEQALVALVANRWAEETFQPKRRLDFEILAEVKSNSYITKRAKRKYSIF